MPKMSANTNAFAFTVLVGQEIQNCLREEVCRVEGEELMQRIFCQVALQCKDHYPCEQPKHARCTTLPNILGPAGTQKT